MTNSKFGKILSLVTTACLVLLGLTFIICTAHLYFTGGITPYSRERVNEYLAWLVIPMALTLLVAIAGIIYSAIKGEKSDKPTERTSIEMLESYYTRYAKDSFDADTVLLTSQLREKQNVFDMISSLVSSFALVSMVDYLIFIAKFSVESLNSDIMNALKVCLPLTIIAVGIHLVRAYLAEKSAGKQLALIKESIKNFGAPKAIAQKKASKPEKLLNSTNIIRAIILLVAISFVIIGSFNGGMDDVLAKAVKICTECIGLG